MFDTDESIVLVVYVEADDLDNDNETVEVDVEYREEKVGYPLRDVTTPAECSDTLKKMISKSILKFLKAEQVTKSLFEIIEE